MRLPNRNRPLTVFAAALAALLPLGCNESNTVTAPAMVPPANIAGTWAGTYRSNSAQCAAAATLEQQGARVSGIFKAETCGIAGSVSGTVQGNTFMGEVNMPGCTGGAVSGTMSDAGLSLTVGDFYKELVSGDQEVLPGGAVTLQR